MRDMSRATTERSPGGEVVVYGAPEGALRVDVRLDRETVWLTQRQMADVFETSTDNVSLHLRNIFADGELEETATTEDFSVVRSEGGRQVRRRIRHYDLDAIISVGYRVNSRQAVRFRQWATHTLREHLVRGYTLNERRLAERGLTEAVETLDLLARTLRNQALVEDTGSAVLDLISGYAATWHLLLEYDEDRLGAPAGVKPANTALEYDRAVETIVEFKREMMVRGEAPPSSAPCAVTCSKPSSATSSRPCSGNRSTVPGRRKRRTFSTSWSRTIPSPMATSGSARCCSWSISDRSVWSIRSIRRPLPL